jgi:hypothetical protein
MAVAAALIHIGVSLRLHQAKMLINGRLKCRRGTRLGRRVYRSTSLRLKRNRASNAEIYKTVFKSRSVRNVGEMSSRRRQEDKSL